MKFFLRKKVYAAAAAALTLVWVLLYANRYHIYRCLPARDGGELVLSGGVLVDRVAHQPFSGRARLKNGEQTLVLSYDEGRPDGLGVACQDGRIKEIVNWKKGRRDGKFMSPLLPERPGIYPYELSRRHSRRILCDVCGKRRADCGGFS